MVSKADIQMYSVVSIGLDKKHCSGFKVLQKAQFRFVINTRSSYSIILSLSKDIFLILQFAYYVHAYYLLF